MYETLNSVMPRKGLSASLEYIASPFFTAYFYIDSIYAAFNYQYIALRFNIKLSLNEIASILLDILFMENEVITI